MKDRENKLARLRSSVAIVAIAWSVFFECSWGPNSYFGVAGSGIAFANAHFAGIPQPGKPYEFIGLKQNLFSALETFGRNLGIGIKIDEDIQDRETKTVSGLTRIQFLRLLSKKHDFSWYFDGLVLHIVARKNLVSKAFVFNAYTGKEAERAIRKSGVYRAEFIHQTTHDTRVLYVSGPQVYLSVLDELFKSFDKTSPIEIKIERGLRSIVQTPRAGVKSSDNQTPYPYRNHPHLWIGPRPRTTANPSLEVGVDR